MALILPNSVCAICGENLDRPYTATSGVAFAKEHRLYRYCDAPLHNDCFEKWPDRTEFVGGYFQSTLHSFKAGLTGHLLAEGVNWALICGPYARTDLRPAVEAGWFSAEAAEDMKEKLGDKPQYVTVILSEWLAQLNTNWDGWEHFVHEKYREHLEGGILLDVEAIMEQVRQLAPDNDALQTLLKNPKLS